MQAANRSEGFELVLVGFSPGVRLEAIARHLGWTGVVLSDRDRSLYQALGVGRTSWWHVYTPGTLAVYTQALLRGERIHRPEEDTRQLGADAIMVDGVVRRLWRPRSPDDRPPAEAILDEARALRRDPRDDA